MKASGKIEVDKVLYRGFVARDLALSWDLKGITPDLRGLSGWAKLGTAGGSFESDEHTGGKSGLVRALLIPLTVLKQIGRPGGALHVLPSFDKLHFFRYPGRLMSLHGAS